jgi:hypothetical protein
MFSWYQFRIDASPKLQQGNLIKAPPPVQPAPPSGEPPAGQLELGVSPPVPNHVNLIMPINILSECDR